MSMTTTVVVNTALEAAAGVGILGLGAWAIKTGRDEFRAFHSPEEGRARRAASARAAQAASPDVWSEPAAAAAVAEPARR